MSDSRFDGFAEHVICLRDGGQPIPKGAELATQFGVHVGTISRWYARLVNDGRWRWGPRTPFDDFAEHVIGLRDGGHPIPKGAELATQFGVHEGTISRWYARLVNDGRWRWDPRTPFDDFAEHVIGLRDGGHPIPSQGTLATQFGVSQAAISQRYARLMNDGRWEFPQRASFDDFAEHVIGLRDGRQPIPTQGTLATQFGVDRTTISNWYARLVDDGRWELPQRASFDDFAEHAIGLRDDGQPIPTQGTLATQFGVSQTTISKWYARLVDDGRWEPRTPFDDFAEHVIGLRDGGQPIPKGAELATQFGLSQQTISQWYARLVNDGRWEPRTAFDDFAEHMFGLRDGGQPIPTQETLAKQFGVVPRTISLWNARLVNDDRWKLPQQAALKVIAGESPAAGVVNIKDWKPGMMVSGAEIIGALDDERATLVLDRGFARSVPQLVHLNIDNPDLSNDAKSALKGIPDGTRITIYPNGSLTVLPQSQAQPKKNDSSSPKKTTGGTTSLRHAPKL
jgi:DNA-binding transcriptional regulator YhcF (GntR family)